VYRPEKIISERILIQKLCLEGHFKFSKTCSADSKNHVLNNVLSKGWELEAFLTPKKRSAIKATKNSCDQVLEIKIKKKL